MSYFTRINNLFIVFAVFWILLSVLLVVNTAYFSALRPYQIITLLLVITLVLFILIFHNNRILVNNHKKLLESQIDFQFLFNNSHLGYLKLTRDGHFLDMNKMFEEISGYKFRELKKMVFNDLTFRGGKYKDFKGWEVLNSGFPALSTEQPILTKNGKIRWIWLSGTFFKKNPPDDLEYFVLVCEDITKRKEVEEKYRALFAKSPIPLFIYASDSLKFLEVNEAMVFKYGFSKEEFLTMTIADIKPPDLKEYIAAVNKEQIREIATKHQLKSGKIIDVYLMPHNIEFQGKEAVFVTVNDVTLQKNTEQELISSVFEATEKERERMARELHDGLTQTLTTASLFLDSIWGETKPFISLKTKQKFQYTLRLLNNCIEESRGIAQSIMPNTIKEFGLHFGVEDLVETFNNLHPDIGISFRGNIQDQRFEPSMELHIFRIIQEALQNAIKHSHASEIIVSIIDIKGALDINIADNGCGYDHIYYDKPKGLGLRSMKNRAIIIGGTLNIHTTPGKGTKVNLFLPNIARNGTDKNRHGR